MSDLLDTSESRLIARLVCKDSIKLALRSSAENAATAAVLRGLSQSQSAELERKKATFAGGLCLV